MNTTSRKLRFGVEVLDQSFEEAPVLEAVEKNIDRYGIQEILFWGGLTILQRKISVESSGLTLVATRATFGAS